MIMKLAFVNPDHERIYNEARAALDAEIERQKQEWFRMNVEWGKLNPHIAADNRRWLNQHFAQCRRPYEKILTDIMALCSTVTMIVEESRAST